MEQFQQERVEPRKGCICDELLENNQSRQDLEEMWRGLLKADQNSKACWCIFHEPKIDQQSPAVQRLHQHGLCRITALLSQRKPSTEKPSTERDRWNAFYYISQTNKAKNCLIIDDAIVPVCGYEQQLVRIREQMEKKKAGECDMLLLSHFPLFGYAVKEDFSMYRAHTSWMYACVLTASGMKKMARESSADVVAKYGDISFHSYLHSTMIQYACSPQIFVRSPTVNESWVVSLHRVAVNNCGSFLDLAMLLFLPLFAACFGFWLFRLFFSLVLIPVIVAIVVGILYLQLPSLPQEAQVAAKATDRGDL